MTKRDQKSNPWPLAGQESDALTSLSQLKKMNDIIVKFTRYNQLLDISWVLCFSLDVFNRSKND